MQNVLDQIKLEGFEHNLKTMSVKPKLLKDGTTAYFVVTEDGAICGVYDSEKRAQQKLPIIAYNLYRGKMPAKLVVKPKNKNKRK
jgi:hypothetical protein